MGSMKPRTVHFCIDEGSHTSCCVGLSDALLCFVVLVFANFARSNSPSYPACTRAWTARSFAVWIKGCNSSASSSPSPTDHLTFLSLRHRRVMPSLVAAPTFSHAETHMSRLNPRWNANTSMLNSDCASYPPNTGSPTSFGWRLTLLSFFNLASTKSSRFIADWILKGP